MKTMLSLKSSKAVSINSARHFYSSISISPGTRRIRADGRQHESKQRLRRHGQARSAHAEHPVRHVWPLRTLERSHWRPLSVAKKSASHVRVGESRLEGPSVLR